MKIIIISIVILFVICGCGDIENVNLTQPSTANIIRVPDDAATIQGAIDLAESGYKVIVADGIYGGDGNRDINFYGKAIILQSKNGPDKTIIDCGGSVNEFHRGFYFNSHENDSTIILGFTIKNGYNNSGGAVYCQSSSPKFVSCIFSENTAATSGGAIWCKSSQVVFINCNFTVNNASVGSAIFIAAGATPKLENCLIAFNDSSSAIYMNSRDKPNFECSNIFGNSGGDWIDKIADQEGLKGNISFDPKFCDLDNSNYFFRSSSPCLAENNSCGEIIGALRLGCM